MPNKFIKIQQSTHENKANITHELGKINKNHLQMVMGSRLHKLKLLRQREKGEKEIGGSQIEELTKEGDRICAKRRTRDEGDKN